MSIFDEARKIAMTPKGGQREPVLRTKREPSKNEQEAQWQGVGFGLMFCCHKVSYFDTCGGCKRDKAKANLLLRRFLSKHGVE